MEKITEESVEEFNGCTEGSLEGLSTLPVEEESHESEKEIVKRKSVFWRRPATKVYADNFGFSVNGYQCMIDYLDKKDSGFSADKSEVHLPFLEERCLKKYCSQNPFKLYTNQDIDKFIAKGEKIRTQIRQNDAIGRSNVYRRTHTNWSMTRKYVQLVKNSFICDFRKLHCNKNIIKDPLPKVSVTPSISDQPNHTLSSLFEKIIFPDMESANFLATYVRNKLDHENEMAARRERLKGLDDEYEQTLKKLAFTVDRIGQSRNESTPVVISPYGRVYHTQDMLDVADDLIHYNRARRQQDIYRLACDVNSVLDGTPKSRPYRRNADLDDTCRIDPTRIAIAKHNAEAALSARNAGKPNPAYEETDVEMLRNRYLNKELPSEFVVEIEPPRRAKKHQHEDVISDVQTRIMNRARELGGVSSEARRIRNRAKFVNTVSPRPDTGAVDLRVAPSRTERNIDNMARSFAHIGRAVRKFDVEDEVDEPVSNLNTFATKTYCTREFDKPIPEYPSDSIYVRNAAMRARERNALLNNN